MRGTLAPRRAPGRGAPVHQAGFTKALQGPRRPARRRCRPPATAWAPFARRPSRGLPGPIRESRRRPQLAHCAECAPLLASIKPHVSGAAGRRGSGSVEPRWTRGTSVLMIGAGCTGVRTAIEADDAGPDDCDRLQLPPDPPSPLQHGERVSVDAALGNLPPKTIPRRHAFDTVEGDADYLGGPDAIGSPCLGAGGRLPARDSVAVFSRTEDAVSRSGPSSAASAPRTACAAGHHGPRPRPGNPQRSSSAESGCKRSASARRLVVDGDRPPRA